MKYFIFLYSVINLFELNDMTKQEAIKAMREGKKVTHVWFSPDEWMTMEGDIIILEDGVKCSQREFWQWRTDHTWDNEYSIYKT